MEDHPPPTACDEAESQDLARLLREKQGRADEFLTAQRRRIDDLESAIAGQVQTLMSQLAATETESRRRNVAVDDELARLQQQADDLARVKQDIAAEHERLDESRRQFESWQRELTSRAEADLAQRRRELEQAEGDLRSIMQAASAAQQQHAADAELLRSQRAELEEARRELEQALAHLADERARTRAQRKTIAAALRVERAEQASALERRRGAFEAELAQRRAELDRRCDETARRSAALDQRAAAIEQRESEADRRAAELAARQDELARQAAELDRKQAELALRRETSEGESGPAAAADPNLRAELEQLRQEREQLIQSLAQAQSQLRKASADAQQQEDLRRRFEMAIQDVRELKARNAQLEEDAARARRAAVAAGSVASKSGASGEAFDWESQKQQMLASLESDFDDGDDEDRHQRLTIEGTIQITDQVVAEKDREIAELKQLLDNQSANLGSVAVGATAIAQVLNQDELISQERERLAQQQAEWREKLRQAEIEVSLERAKIARERMELEERLQAFEAERAKYAGSEVAGEGKGKEGGKPAARRWLSRLGLRDTDARG